MGAVTDHASVTDGRVECAIANVGKGGEAWCQGGTTGQIILNFLNAQVPEGVPTCWTPVVSFTPIKENSTLTIDLPYGPEYVNSVSSSSEPTITLSKVGICL